jgi:hypothetical protein
MNWRTAATEKIACVRRRDLSVIADCAYYFRSSHALLNADFCQSVVDDISSDLLGTAKAVKD